MDYDFISPANFKELIDDLKKDIKLLLVENKKLKREIEDLGEQNEIKDKKINIMELELKEYKCYDQDKINELMYNETVNIFS